MYLFFTFALHKGEWLTSRPIRFTPRARAPASIEQKVEWAPEPIWTFGEDKNHFSIPGFDSGPSSPQPGLYPDCTLLNMCHKIPSAQFIRLHPSKHHEPLDQWHTVAVTEDL